MHIIAPCFGDCELNCTQDDCSDTFQKEMEFLTGSPCQDMLDHNKGQKSAVQGCKATTKLESNRSNSCKPLLHFCNCLKTSLSSCKGAGPLELTLLSREPPADFSASQQGDL